MSSLVFHRRFHDGHLVSYDSPAGYFSTPLPDEYSDTVLLIGAARRSFCVCTVGHRVLAGKKRSTRSKVQKKLIITYVRSGKVIINGNTVSAGQGYYTCPGEARGLVFPEGEATEIYWLSLRGQNIDEKIREAGLSVSERLFYCEWVDQVAYLCNSILYRDHGRTDEETYLSGLWSMILSYHRAHTLEKNSFGGPKRACVEEAKRYIEDHFTYDIHISDVAAACYTSVNYLDNIFREMNEMSPRSYLVSLRLAMAKQLLCDTDLPVKEIAYKVGYNDYMQLSVAFRRAFQMSPSEYRRASRKDTV